MIEFYTGKREGYIFFSGRHKGLILDDGPNEYPIDSAELLINGKFVFMENLTLELLKKKELYGSKARIKQKQVAQFIN
ncbi:hypothetical protein DX932_32430 [Bacillus cereus]|uniref:Uncharacterized protein n=1 Tax=Bacillus cereus TaxID=1396 RepID=A0A9W7PYQ7_BACCE|nr:hypothetical protein [Bacillus cereus]KAA6448127.1 hypothetical protein DX932_32430 [Bacillus cereus]